LHPNDKGKADSNFAGSFLVGVLTGDVLADWDHFSSIIPRWRSFDAAYG
jgi:hypothetical protein